MRSDPTENTGHGFLTRFSSSCINWDATKTQAPAEVLQAGFQLVYFLVPDRATAIDILSRALEKARLRSRRETRRLYWRDKHADRRFRRIARADIDTLQWLIMLESTEDEKSQERTEQPSLKGIVARYIKHLVQVASGLSPFYVNVGMNRVLRNYTTPEAQRLYEMLTSRFPGTDEYRRAKAVLMEKMTERFGTLLKITRVEHGELRFEALEDQQQWSSFVDDCLKLLTPWSTRGHCSEFLAVPLVAAIDEQRTDRNESEITLCHVLIEPQCSKQVLTQLALDPPDTKLALPRFDMPPPQRRNDSGNQSGPAPELTLMELDEIQRRLAAVDARRRSIAPRLVTIVVDGVEQVQLDLSRKSQLELEIEEGAKLIEIRGEDNRGPVLLATHFISYEDSGFESSQDAAILSTGRIKFGIRPMVAPVGDAPRAMLCLRYLPKLEFLRPGAVWRDLTESRRPIISVALAGLTMALIAWAVTGAFYRHKVNELEHQLREARRNPQRPLPTSGEAIVSYTLIQDDQRIRNMEMMGIPEIVLQPQVRAISLELPLSRVTETQGFIIELKLFRGEITLMTLNSIQATQTEAGSRIAMVVPTALLRADTYYTVRVHSSEATIDFTFKVVGNEHTR
jgi:hypothetical protein